MKFIFFILLLSFGSRSVLAASADESRRPCHRLVRMKELDGKVKCPAEALDDRKTRIDAEDSKSSEGNDDHVITSQKPNSTQIPMEEIEGAFKDSRELKNPHQAVEEAMALALAKGIAKGEISPEGDPKDDGSPREAVEASSLVPPSCSSTSAAAASASASSSPAKVHPEVPTPPPSRRSIAHLLSARPITTKPLE